MSTGGQAVLGLVGGVAGFFLAGPLGVGVGQSIMYGAQAGLMLGGYLFPPKGPTVNGPRLSDLSVQTATYGAVIPRVYGAVTVNGNVFWLENNQIKETVTKKKTGGKGGGAKTTTRTYSYSATFAVGLCKGPIVGVRRIWVGPDLIYDAGSSDPATITASNQAASGFAIYTGTDTQSPDARIQATLGVANTPAWRGRAYIVFYDLQLARYGNSLMGAQVRVEVMRVGVVYDYPSTDHYSLPINTAYSKTAWNGQVWCTLDAKQTSSDKNCYTSSDGGATWVSHPLPSVYPEATNWVSVCGSPSGTLIAIRYWNPDSHVYRSTDNGATWTSIAAGISLRPNKICYGNGRFVIVSWIDGKSLISTNDGVSWSSGNLPTFSDYGSDVYWCEGLAKFFFAYYSWGGSKNHITSSSDGLTWSTPIAIYPSANWAHYASIGSFLVLTSLGGGAGMLTTHDGTTWTRTAPGSNPFAGNMDGITTDGTVFIGVAGLNYYISTDLVSITNKSFSYNGFTGWAGKTPLWNGTQCLLLSSGGDLRATSIDKQFIAPAVESLASVVSSECLNSGLLTAADLDVSALTQTVRGYRIGTVGAIRAALEPLQAAWPFDVRQHGYKIQFVARGGASVVTIPQADLDARNAGENPGVHITTSREMDSQLPRRVTVQHLDYDREYNTGSQYAERLNTAAINKSVLDLPIVLTATEAAGKAEVLLYLYWLERYDVAITLPPTYLQLEPGDVVTLVTPEGNVQLRLVEVDYLSDGRVQCKAKYANAAIYTPTAVASSPSVSGPTTITPVGASVYSLLDIPLLSSAQSGACFVAAMTGALAGWNGGVLMQSTDAGSTWASLQDFGPPGSVLGSCSNSLSSAESRMIDAGSTLTVTLTQGALYSVTQIAMLGGANHFAYGVNGRWEIIAAQTCTLVSGTTYTLTNFLRGRFGTEWAMGMHSNGDSLILLDTTDMATIAMSSGAIGLPYLYRGITVDRDLSTDSNRSFTYQGVNLKPLSPIALTGSIDPSSSDWSLSWIRRTRTGGEWRDNVDASLGEDSEAYQVDVFADGTYATVLRTISATSPALTYSSAMQAADFGGNQSTLYLKVYQLSSSVGRGYPLTQSITR